MIRHNLKVIYRQMLRSKAYSLINIGGLAMGMVVAMLIGLWVYDELSFNQYHDNYDNIVQVLRNGEFRGTKRTNTSQTTGVASVMNEHFPDRFEEVFMTLWMERPELITHEKKKLREVGLFIEENTPEILGFEMIRGTLDGLKDVKSIMLSASFAERLFGDADPMNEMVRLNGRTDLLVTGVYEDIPTNSTFANAHYVSRLENMVGQKGMNVWDNQNINIYAKVNPNIDLKETAELLTQKTLPYFEEAGRDYVKFFTLLPMKDWHLRSEFEDYKPVTSQQMKVIWLYATIGAFVLILACINFTNLSTARSERRARETGIRKTLGSIRSELIAQFYMESVLYSLLSFGLSLILLAMLLPWFNETAAKSIEAPWSMAGFWYTSGVFVGLTALLAGSYPAFYLSSFSPVQALKGRFKVGKNASLPRRVLVVFQFTVSIALIIGTITINNQIQTARNRPVGYSPKGLISLKRSSSRFAKNFELVKTELMRTGYAEAIGGSDFSIVNNLGRWNSGWSWEGMEAGFDETFNTINISNGYAEAVGMEFIMGRDFSPEMETDKNAILINRSAMELMQLDDPLGLVVNYAPSWREPGNYTIIGVVEDMIKDSPFGNTHPLVMFFGESWVNYMFIRLNPNKSASESIEGLKAAFEKVLPNDPFDFSFADEDYNKKFIAEERISAQSGFFSIVGILISCLGLFGLASFITEQRTKEIGIRKVLGASISHILMLLSKDFAFLLMIACCIAIPIAYSVLDQWLQTYEVRTTLTWWIFTIAGAAALLVTLLTISFHAFKAAVANPVDSLSSE